jgi:hypothetical protein
MSHEGNDKVIDSQRDEELEVIEVSHFEVDGRPVTLTVTAPPKPISNEEWKTKEEKERREAIKDKGHYCQDFVCHGMYERDNGSLNDYYYCGKCNELLQVG